MTHVEFALSAMRDGITPDRRSCQLLLEIIRKGLADLRREIGLLDQRSRTAFRSIYRSEARDLLAAARHFRRGLRS